MKSTVLLDVVAYQHLMTVSSKKNHYQIASFAFKFFSVDLQTNESFHKLLLNFSLSYVEATIRESLRHETLVPSGLPHTATADTQFMGYDIPKVS